MPPIAVALAALFACLAASWAPAQTTIRVATIDLGDARTEDLRDGSSPRLRQAAESLQRLRPNIVLITGLACPMPGAPGFAEGDAPDAAARRLHELYLAHPQREGLTPLSMRWFAERPNRGVPSGLDLDRNGRVVTKLPPAPAPGEWSDEAALREYAGDCWAPGAFPGQRGMALFVDSRLTIDAPRIRTFRLLPWDYMQGAFLPVRPDGSPWFEGEARALARLSTSGHWDVPVLLPDAARLHVLCSAPIEPECGQRPDAPEPADAGGLPRDLAARRHHDEVCFWAEYVTEAGWIVDDAGGEGGLERTAAFVVVGALAADPQRTRTFKDPITTGLGSCRRINLEFVPRTPAGTPDEGPSDTREGLGRLDYVLPARWLRVAGGGVWRGASGVGSVPGPAVAAHPATKEVRAGRPVWVDLEVPPAAR